MTTISDLESLHKQTLDPSTFVTLSNSCRDLLQLLDSHSLIARDRARKSYYSIANKCGQHLARVIHPRAPRSPVPFITKSDQTKVFDCRGISTAFKDFYSQLYNLSQTSLPSPVPPSQDPMQTYIMETALPMIDPQESADLDGPLLEPEFLGVIKGLNVQAPMATPRGFTKPLRLCWSRS